MLQKNGVSVSDYVPEYSIFQTAISDVTEIEMFLTVTVNRTPGSGGPINTHTQQGGVLYLVFWWCFSLQLGSAVKSPNSSPAAIPKPSKLLAEVYI